MPGPTERPLRVVSIIDALPVESGGAERLAAVLTMRLDPNRFEGILCPTRRAGGPLLEQAVAAGVRVVPLARRSKASLWSWRPLVHLLREERIDILHAHKFGSNVWASMLGPAAGVPVLVAHEHSWSYRGQPLRRFLDRELIARRADALIAVSSEDRRCMIEVERIDPAKIVVVPNGVEIPQDDSHDVRTELGIDSTVPVVGTVGNLVPVKGFDVLVESAALLRERHPDLRVLIVGHGVGEADLRRRTAAAGVEDTVTLLGPRPRSEVPAFIRAFDVAVCCSRREGSPLSVMEYMAAGKPVVATRVGGLPELVRDGETGTLVQPEDPRALADGIASLLDEPERGRAMGRRGRELQRREYSLDRQVERIEELYESLYSRTRRAREENWHPRSFAASQ